MVQQKYQRQLKRPIRRGPAGIAQRQTFASVALDLVPSYSAPSTTTPTFSTAVSFSAPTSSVVTYTSVSVPPPSTPVPIPSRPILPPPRPIRQPRSISRWPEPMDLDPPSGEIIYSSSHLQPSSWWCPEPVDLDPSGLLPSNRWPEPMDLDPPGLLTFTPLDIKIDPPSRWPEPMEF